MENKKISQLDPYSGNPDSFDIPGVADGQTLKTNLGAAILQKALSERLLRPSDLKTVNGVPLTGPGDVALDVANPFKGRFPAGTTETENLPSGNGVPRVGDFAYVDTVDGNNNPVLKIFDCLADGVWHDSGRTADPANVNTFADGEQLGQVHIVNSLKNGRKQDVLSAKQGTVLAKKIAEDAMDREDKGEYLATLTGYMNLYIYSTGKWRVPNDDYRCSMIEIPVGVKTVAITANNTNPAYYAFLNATTPRANGDTPDYADGYSNRETIPAGESVLVDVPARQEGKSMYLYLYLGQAYDFTYRPSGLVYYTSKDTTLSTGQSIKNVSLTNDTVGLSDSTIVSQKGLQEALTYREPVDFYDKTLGIVMIPRIATNTNNGSFYCNTKSSTTKNYYSSRLIPVQPGQIYYFKSGNLGKYPSFAFVKALEASDIESLLSKDEKYAGTGLLIANPETGNYTTTLSSNMSPYVVIPENCAYLSIAWRVVDDDGVVNASPKWRRPGELSLVKAGSDKLTVNDAVNVILSETKIVFNGLRLINHIVSGHDNWYNNPSQGEVNTSYVLPVCPGQIFTVTANGNRPAFWSFMTDVPDERTSAEPAEVVPGTTRMLCSSGTTKTFAIPEGCRYLSIIWLGGNVNDCTPAEMKFKISANAADNSQNGERQDLDFHDENVRSSKVGLSESNAVPLVTDTVYGCSGSASDEIKNVEYTGYFSVATRILVKMTNGNSHATPKIKINNSNTSYPVVYGNNMADATNGWFAGELVWLQFDGTNIVLTKFDDTQIVGTNSVAVRNLSKQQRNVQKLCNRYRFLKWKPLKSNATVDNFTVGIPRHNHAGQTSWRSAANQPYGIPYSSCVQDQKYVGLNVSVYTFLSAVNNPFSLLYTETIQKGSRMRTAWNRDYQGDNSSAYMGLVCCAFTAAVTGCMRNWNNGEFKPVAEQGYEFVIINNTDTITPDSIRVGDVFDSPAHSIVVYQLFQDVFTGDITHVRFAESTSGGSATPDPIYGCRFCLMSMADFVNVYMKGYEYIHYRYIKLYQNNLENNGENPLLAASLPTDPANIILNYSDIATDVIKPGRDGDGGSNDSAEQENNAYVFSNEICTISGDKVTFPIGEYDIGNIIALNYNLDGRSLGNYDRIKVYRRDNGSTGAYTLLNTYLVEQIDDNDLIQYLRGHTLVLDRPVDSSSCGEYYACMATDSTDSNEKTYWEVIDNPVTITEQVGGYLIKWTQPITALGMMLIEENTGHDPHFGGIGDTDALRKQRTISLNTNNLLNKEYFLESWRLKNVDITKLYIRLLTIGIYGITGVYVKLTPEE